MFRRIRKWYLSTTNWPKWHFHVWEQARDGFGRYHAVCQICGRFKDR